MVNGGKIMSKELDWLLSLSRVCVTALSGSALQLALQMASEFKQGYDSIKAHEKLSGLTDPIGSLHSDVPMLATVLFNAMNEQGFITVTLTDRVLEKYRAPLARLNAKSYIELENMAGCKYPASITLSDPEFVIYATFVSGHSESLNKITEIFDSSDYGAWLNGKVVAEQADCSMCLVDAFFELWASQGLGNKSGMIQESRFEKAV